MCVLCWHLLIFPGSCPPSIFSASELNFRVRNGNGWTLTAINTNCVPSSSDDFVSIPQRFTFVNTFFKKFYFLLLLNAYSLIITNVTGPPAIAASTVAQNCESFKVFMVINVTKKYIIKFGT